MASRAGERTLQQITYVVIHHDANSNPAKSLTRLKTLAKAYDALHGKKAYAMYTDGSKGFKHASYHEMIAWDGANIQVQDYKFKRHAAGDGAAYFNSKHNPNSTNHSGIHIMLSGYFHPSHNHVPTEAMLNKVAKIIYTFEKENNTSLRVRGHREVSDKYTACPGDKMMQPDRKYIKDIIKRVNAMHLKDEMDGNIGDWKDLVHTTAFAKVRAIRDTYLVNFLTGERIKKYLKGTYMEFKNIYNVTHYLTEYSYSKNLPNGFLLKDFEPVFLNPPKPPEPTCEEKIAELKEQLNKRDIALKGNKETIRLLREGKEQSDSKLDEYQFVIMILSGMKDIFLSIIKLFQKKGSSNKLSSPQGETTNTKGSD